MQPTVYQKPELRDANDNIIQQGAFGKNTALANATNDGWIDYVANDLEFLYDLAKDEIVPVPSLPASGQTNKTYLLTTTGVSYRWSGTQWVAVSSSEAVGRAETAATNAQNYANAAQQSADDAQDVADDMADHLAQIDQNTGGISANSKRIGNIEKLLQGNLYDYQTDDTVAYEKTVPAGAMPYAGIEKIGGKTVVMNQVCSTTISSNTTGLTVTRNDDGSYTLNGTSVNGNLNFKIENIYRGHKYIVFGCPSGHSVYMGIAGVYSDIGSGAIWTSTATGASTLRLQTSADVVFDNVKLYTNAIDMTIVFGAGNEPTTVEEFKAMFPADYYPYNAGELLSAGVTEVVSKKADTTTLATYPIPAEVQALEGYGWSAGTAYNYIDYERKVFVQNVGSRAYASGDESNTAVTTDMTTTYYPLATPIETDISQYLTDNLVEVGAGGTLTFPNSNGDDYHIPVPSTETYMIDLQEAISNG